MNQPTTAELNTLLSLLDATSLGEEDTEQTITQLCQEAATPFGAVAAVCIYPRFIPLANRLLANTPVKIGCVANFPTGKEPVETVIETIKTAIRQGADEIDLVIPYHDVLAGNFQSTAELVQAAKKACGECTLKVILETGALQDPARIEKTADCVIKAGADFLKTSTGKLPIGATKEAVACLINVVKTHNKTVGLKIAGGIKTISDALEFLGMVRNELGEDYLVPSHCRIGSSRLVYSIVEVFSHG